MAGSASPHSPHPPTRARLGTPGGPLVRALVAELAALPDEELAPLAERLAGLVAERPAPPSRPATLPDTMESIRVI